MRNLKNASVHVAQISADEATIKTCSVRFYLFSDKNKHTTHNNKTMWLKRQGQEAAHKLLGWTVGRQPSLAPSETSFTATQQPSTGLCKQSFEKIKNDSRQGLLYSFLASADVATPTVHQWDSETVQCSSSSKKIEQTAAFENRTEQTCHATSGSDIEKMHQWVRNQSYTWDAATCLDAQ